MNQNINKLDERYFQLKSAVDKIQGFMTDGSMAVWDALLAFQNDRNVRGHLGEIGVYKGKSALILAHHQRAEEQLWLIDYSDFIEEAKVNLAPFNRHQIRIIKQKSIALNRLPELNSQKRTFRWFHVDGEHTGQAVTNDLNIANELLADEGIICIDDFFNPAYPQITSATFAFLEAHRYELSMFACGSNKGYLARPNYLRHYMEMIRSSLARELKARSFTDFTLWKSSPSEDYNCWGIHFRYGDCDYRGLDSNPDEI